MLEEAEDRAARAAVEGSLTGWSLVRALERGTAFLDVDMCPQWKDAAISQPPKPYNDNAPVAQQQAHKPLVIIESPYGGDVVRNTEYARACLLDSLRRGEAPIASHLLHTQVLDDMRPDERELGIEAGLAWYRVAEKCLVYEDLGISNGMRAGIARAYDHGVPWEFRSLTAWRAVA